MQEVIYMNTQKSSHPSPWNPYQLFSSFMFITWFGAGILLSLNWKRLGKPEWVLKTMLLSIFIPAGAIAVVIGWVLFFIDANLPEPLMMSVPMLGMTTNFGYLWALARLQNGAYKEFKSQGFAAIQDYQYDVDGAMSFGVIAAIAFAAILMIVIPLFG